MDGITFQKLREIEARFAELETGMSDPAVAQDPAAYQKLAREAKEIGSVVERYRAYKNALQEIAKVQEMARVETDPELREMAHEEARVLEAKCSALDAEIPLLLIPKDPNDDKNVLLEIRAGTGGDEAALFAGDLFRMYTRFAERRGWKMEIFELSYGTLNGVKEAVFAVRGLNAYGELRSEAGVHRVQRVPATEASGRIHTSAATVAVLPEAEDVDVKIEPNDLRIDVFRSGGPGGQSVNTTDSAVRITHLPTGLVVQCQDQKSQLQNKIKAMEVLRSRLLDKRIAEQEAARARERRTMVGTGDRSAKIRTYNFPQSRVTDHRLGLSAHNLQAVIDGDLDEFVKALKLQRKAERIAEASSSSAP